MFKYELGSLVVSKTTGLRGPIMSMVHNISTGASEYCIQPRVYKDTMRPAGVWVYEDDLRIIEQGTQRKLDDLSTGCPMSKIT